MINLKEETLKVLAYNGKTWADVEWVGLEQKVVPKDSFLLIADREYDNGYGGNEVNMSLIVVGKDFWLERHEYDGSEWWEFKQMPKKPVVMLEYNNQLFLE